VKAQVGGWTRTYLPRGAHLLDVVGEQLGVLPPQRHQLLVGAVARLLRRGQPRLQFVAAVGAEGRPVRLRARELRGQRRRCLGSQSVRVPGFRAQALHFGVGESQQVAHFLHFVEAVGGRGGDGGGGGGRWGCRGHMGRGHVERAQATEAAGAQRVQQCGVKRRRLHVILQLHSDPRLRGGGGALRRHRPKGDVVEKAGAGRVVLERPRVVRRLRRLGGEWGPKAQQAGDIEQVAGAAARRGVHVC
jgi:hypothetical protein